MCFFSDGAVRCGAVLSNRTAPHRTARFYKYEKPHRGLVLHREKQLLIFSDSDGSRSQNLTPGREMPQSMQRGPLADFLL